MSKFYLNTDYRTILYAICRVGLGIYLLIHSIFRVINFDEFLASAISYLPEESSISFLAYLTPLIPFMEFFLAVMILTGIYTNIALKWAVGIGVFFMLMFHYLDDLSGAIEHSYSVIIKLLLLFGIYYNKFSLDYYNQWNVAKETQVYQQQD